MVKALSYASAFTVFTIHAMNHRSPTTRMCILNKLLLAAVATIGAGVLNGCLHGSQMDVPLLSNSQTPTEKNRAVETPKDCHELTVKSITVSTQYHAGPPESDSPATIAVAPLDSAEVRTISAFGPMLGSMDSREIQTDLKCTDKGFALTATITRSADYQGDVLKNVFWRPKIVLAIELHAREITFESTWRMRLSTGSELKHAQTPPYSSQTYPLILSKTIRNTDQ